MSSMVAFLENDETLVWLVITQLWIQAVWAA